MRATKQDRTSAEIYGERLRRHPSSRRITLIGLPRDIDQAIAELQSNITYDDLQVKVLVADETD